MAVKLFALEENDVVEAETLVETTPEEGAVAEVEAETQEEVAETQDQSEAINEGIEAADQLEEVQEVVEKAVEEGEGLTEPAAEAIRIAVEAISARIGYDPKKMAGLRAIYASESFASPSSRLANTKIALEGIGEILANLWKKIKEAFKNLMAKISNFWDKYVFGLQKTKAALESMKAKVSRSSGKINGEIYREEAPSSLVQAFAGKDDISSNVVKEFIKAHSEVHASSTSKLDELENNITKELTSKGYLTDTKNSNITYASLVYGKTFKLEVKGDITSEDFEIEFSEEDKDDKEEKLGISISSKTDVIAILNDTIKLMAETIKVRDKIGKFKESISKAFSEGEKALFGEKGSLANAKPEEKKVARDGIKNTYKYVNAVINIINKAQTQNVKLAKAVLSYSAFCLKNYK